MSDFIRQTTEQLAKDGFVALAPDLLSRRGGTPSSTDDARKVIAGLNPDTVTLDLDASVAYLRTVKAARRDRIGVIGFCWGGGQSFRYATNNPALGAFVVCYGPGPEAAAIARIRASGLGVYAENDARIDAGLTDVAAAVKQYAKDYHYAIYPGVGHGFLRPREKPEVADSAIVSASPGLPADVSPMITPRVAFRNATSKSSAAPAVAFDASTAIGPV